VIGIFSVGKPLGKSWGKSGSRAASRLPVPSTRTEPRTRRSSRVGAIARFDAPSSTIACHARLIAVLVPSDLRFGRGGGPRVPAVRHCSRQAALSGAVHARIVCPCVMDASSWSSCWT
jgi:hypothetical protein